MQTKVGVMVYAAALSDNDCEEFRVLLVNDPRSYRDSLTLALRRLRPAIRFLAADPDRADVEIKSFVPHLVVLSDAQLIGKDVEWSWVLLYPEGTQLAIVGTPSESRRIASFDLDELLGFLDEVKSLRCGAGLSRGTVI